MNHSDLMRRLKNDLADVYSDKDMDGIYVCPDDDDTRKVHALIVGPDGTPYEKGFFYFIFTYPENYPLSPPSVKLMTTDNGKVRFNPNLYNCGKVCLSILGTWSGPGWTSVMTTKSVLISIRSLMNEKPFYNEPGYEGKHYEKESRAYNERITHETLRVAVIDMVSTALDPTPSDTCVRGDASIPTATPAESTSVSNIPVSASAVASSEEVQILSVNGVKEGASNEPPNPAPPIDTVSNDSPSASASSGGAKSKKGTKFSKLMNSNYASYSRPRVVQFQMPQVLKEMVIRLFHKKYSYYLELIEKNLAMDGKQITTAMRSYFSETGCHKYDYKGLRPRLEQVYKRIRIDENLANELYESLRTSYCPARTHSPDEEEEMTALFNEN